jgi:hypothetical protein
MSLEGELVFNYTNQGIRENKQLLFHLFPNAFSSADSSPYSKQYLTIYYPEGFSPGSLEINSVTELKTNQALTYKVEGINFWIDLSEPILPGKTVQIGIRFREKIPAAIARFGGYGDLISLGNWYPVLAVNRDGKWQTAEYPPWGDPFFSETASYRVNLTVPEGYVVAHTGSLIKMEKKNNQLIYGMEAQLVRDFALSLSPGYQQKSEKVGKTTITSYFLPEAEEYGQEAVRISRQAVEFFSDQYGQYPYPNLTVVQSNFLNGGMEYPQLVMMGKNLYSKPYYDAKVLEFVLVHELAHQWWYGLVGNDQLREPWLDEGLANYSTLLYFEHVYGKKETETIKKRFIDLPPGSEKDFLELDLPLTAYRTAESYYTNVYSRGALAFGALHDLLGDRDFNRILREYLKRYKYGYCTIEEFLQLVEKEGRADLKQFRERYFKNS